MRDVELYSCRLCNRALGRAKFSKRDIDKFHQGSVKSMRCVECKFSAALNDKRSEE